MAVEERGYCQEVGSRAFTLWLQAAKRAASPIAKRHIMTIQRIKSGPRMSGAVVHGNTVYLSGQVASQTAGKSVTEQTQEILSIIDSLLSEAGTDKSKLLMANIWLT